ncbi:MAG: hypothetical protein A4E28_00323 [Methanocella sp. PtaU1.Bin125]|nr:MAG: hypothetical protein A4E28_00323 [Methanocella sp. PtaU1.Bin125]
MDGRLRAARTIATVALLLFATNYGYGLAHEAAHAAVIDALGGHVYGIYVNAFGTDAWTEHSVIAGAPGLVLVNLAGMGMTTLLAIVFAAAGQGLIAAFLSARTAIYALNYGPGTDISTVFAAAGSMAIALSLLIVVINIACICYAAAGNARVAAIRKRVIAGLSSS